MMDYFAIYHSWKLVAEEDFARLHQYQSVFIVNIFVIPAAVMTVLKHPGCTVPASLPGQETTGHCAGGVRIRLDIQFHHPDTHPVPAA